MKRFAKIAALLMAVVMVVSAGEGINVSAASGPTISKSSRKIYVGGSTVTNNSYSKGTYTLTIKNRPEKYSVEWSSSDESIAKVAPYKGTSKYKGTVTAVAPGKATITATIIDKTTMPYTKYTRTCKVTVKKNCAAVDITPATVEDMKVGDTVTLKGIMYDSKAKEVVKGKDVTDIIKWTSSDTSVATVSSSGEVKAVGEGKATITCYTIQAATGTYSKIKYATARDTVDINVKQSGVTAMVEAKQLTLNSFRITFAGDYSKKVTKDNLKVSRSNAPSDISKIEFDSTGTVATVTMSASLTSTLAYLVELTGTDATKGTSVTFLASAGKAVRMEIYTDMSGNRVIASDTAPLYYRFFDANGVDVTPLNRNGSEYRALANYVTVKAADYNSFSSVYSNTIWIYEPGVSVPVLATYNDYAGTTFSASATITAVSEASTITGVQAMVTNSPNQGATLDWSKPTTNLSKSDTSNFRLVVRAKKADGKYVYSDDPGSKLTVGYPDNYEQAGAFLSSNGVLFPFEQGTDQAIIKYDGVVIGATSITVGPARIPVKMVTFVDGVESTSVELSDAYGVTNPEVRIALYDNYGDLYPLTSTFGLSLTTNETAGSMYATLSGINSDGTAGVTFWAWGTGTDAGSRQPVIMKYEDGTNLVSGAFNAIIYKPNDKMTTEYKVTVQGDTDAVVNANFDTSKGKKLAIRLVAYKGRVRYQDISLTNSASPAVDQYYCVVKLGDNAITVDLAGDGSVEIPVASVSGSTITKAQAGDYSIVIYRKALNGSDPVISATHVVIKDSQEGASVVKNNSSTSYILSATSTDSEKISAFNQCFTVSIDGIPATVTGIDATSTSGGMFIKSVTVQGHITIGGNSYNVEYPVKVQNAISVQQP